MTRLADFEVRRALASFAQNSQLFALLDAHGIERFAHIAVIEDFPANTVIVQQGEVGRSFYLIADGNVRILVDSGAGEVKEVAQLGAGNFFGEIAVLTVQPRTATVQCIVDSQLIQFDREPVIEILRDYPKVREIIGGVGLLRSEANLQDALDDGIGLAEALESDEEEPAELSLDDVLASPGDDPPPASLAPPSGETDGSLSEGDLFGGPDDGGEEGLS